MAEEVELPEIKSEELEAQEEGAFSYEVDTNVDNELDMSIIPAGQLTSRSVPKLLEMYLNNMETLYKIKLPEAERAVLTTSMKLQDNNLYYKPHGATSKLVLLTNKNGKLKAISTIQKQTGGTEFLEQLGLIRKDGKLVPRVNDFASSQPLEPTVIIRQPVRVEEIEMEILNNPENVSRQIDQVLHDESLKEILTGDDRRELRGLGEMIHSTHSKILSARTSEEHFKFEKNKAQRELDRARSANNENEIKLFEAEVKRFEAQEIVWKNARELLEVDENNQIERIKGILSKKVTLAERIRELFRKEGITIASILTAVGMTISSIALAIKLALNPSDITPTPSPPPGPSKPSYTDKIREALKNFGQFLLDLAKKSASALPSLIGTIVSFLFKTAGQAVGFLAEHLIILLIGAVALFFEKIIKHTSSST
jgi:hypothetical protein